MAFEKFDFPDVPGITEPSTVHVAYRADYGPRWDEGIIEKQPPRLGPEYPSMVCKVDALGNEIAGIQNVEVRVPLATYTPWSTRVGYDGSPYELVDFRGTYMPLPLTQKEKKKSGDPRPSIESLYRNKQDYLKQVRQAADNLVDEGFLLEKDVSYVEQRAVGYWEWVHEL